MRFATWTSMSSKSVWTRKGMKLGASIPAASSKHEGRRTRTHVEITAYSLKEHIAVLSTQCPRSPRGHDDRCSLAAHAIWPISAYYLHVHENTYCPNSMCVRQFGGLPIDGLVSAWKSLHKKSFSDVFRQTWVSWINDVAVILFDFYRVDICCQRVSVRPSVTSRCSTKTAKQKITQTTLDSYVAKDLGEIPTGLPPMGTSNTGGISPVRLHSGWGRHALFRLAIPTKQTHIVLHSTNQFPPASYDKIR